MALWCLAQISSVPVMIFSHDCSKNLKWIQNKPSLHKNIVENEVNDVCDSMAVNQSQTQQRKESMQRSLIIILFQGFARSASPPFMPLALHTDVIVDIWYCSGAEGSPENLGLCSKGEATQIPYFHGESPNQFFTARIGWFPMEWDNIFVWRPSSLKQYFQAIN